MFAKKVLGKILVYEIPNVHDKELFINENKRPKT